MFPFEGLRLFLPAITPSWRFFDAVSASPRVEYALSSAAKASAGEWREFRSRPDVLSLRSMLGCLLWNPRWNENLFLVSLAERLMSNAATAATQAHSERELLLRIARHLIHKEGCDPRAYLQIRLRFVRRVGPDEDLTSEIVFLSSPYPIADLTTL